MTAFTPFFASFRGALGIVLKIPAALLTTFTACF